MKFVYIAVAFCLCGCSKTSTEEIKKEVKHEIKEVKETKSSPLDVKNKSETKTEVKEEKTETSKPL